VTIKTTPKVSIITPSYNQGQYLEKTTLSVLNQSYPNIEYIIIDGGSSDNSVEIIQSCQDQLAYWVSEPDRGQVDAINKGFSASTGDYITWLNSDDILFPDSIQPVAACFEQHPEADFVYGDYALLAPDGSPELIQSCIDFDQRVLLYGRSVISQPASFMRRSLWERLGPLDERFDFCMDIEYWTRSIMAGASTSHSLISIKSDLLRACASRSRS